MEEYNNKQFKEYQTFEMKSPSLKVSEHRRDKKNYQNKSIEIIRKNLSVKHQMLSKYQKQLEKDEINQHQRKKKSKILSNTSFRLMQSQQKRVEMFSQDIGSEDRMEQEKAHHHRTLHTTEHRFITKLLTKQAYYPPSCSGYDMTYCKTNHTVYIFGGVSCTSQLTEGIQHYFYQFHDKIWIEVKPTSMYSPMPRYGHTLTNFGNQLLLFGGVSQYKQKLRDRCFYADLWSYNVNKNSWKIVQVAGENVKSRKSHAACIYQKYYIIHGGINDSEEVISQICWSCVEDKKIRWKTKKVQGRFNHKIQIVQNSQGRDYLFVFGGRNKQLQIISEFLMYPIYAHEGQLFLKQPITIKISQALTPRQNPIVTPIGTGLMIMGGTDQDNNTNQDAWYYDIQKQHLESIDTQLNWHELRGARGVSLSSKFVYILSGSTSKQYKAVQIQKND